MKHNGKNVVKEEVDPYNPALLNLITLDRSLFLNWAFPYH